MPRWAALLPLFLIVGGCGKAAPSNATLVSLIEDRNGLHANAASSELLKQAAISALPEAEGASAAINGCQMTACTYLGTAVIKRGPVTRMRSSASMPFRIRVKGRATLAFIHSPDANPGNNVRMSPTVDFASEQEWSAETDDYGKWTVHRN